MPTSDRHESTGADVPASPTELRSKTLTEALRRPVEVVGVERIGAEFGFSGESYRVVIADDGARYAVVAKLWQLREPSDVVELHFYERLAPTLPVRLPAFHHGAVDSENGRAWLVLEELRHFRQGDDLVRESLPVVLALVGVVADIQATWWGGLGDEGWLSPAPRFRRDSEYLQSRRRDYLDRFGPISDPVTRALFDRIPEALVVATDLLAGAPATLVHQDLALDNVLFLEPDDQPVLLDWARCGRGAGALDLASLLFDVAPLDAFDEVVDCYEAALSSSESVQLDRIATKRWLGGAMVHRFITRTLGVARWAADTPRGLEILDAWIAHTPHVVESWRTLDPDLFDRLLG